MFKTATNKTRRVAGRDFRALESNSEMSHRMTIQRTKYIFPKPSHLDVQTLTSVLAPQAANNTHNLHSANKQVWSSPLPHSLHVRPKTHKMVRRLAQHDASPTITNRQTNTTATLLKSTSSYYNYYTTQPITAE
jgi:hypothetical protein